MSEIIAPSSYHITRVARLHNGHTFVEVLFDTGLFNDFLFGGFPDTVVDYKEDRYGRPYWNSEIKERPFNIEPIVHKAIRDFANEVVEKGHKGDMRDPVLPLLFLKEEHPHTRSLFLSVGKVHSL